MSQGIEKQLKQYLKEIRLPVPVYGKEERVFIKDLKASMTEYIELNLGCTWEDVVSHFEEPEDAVYNYITSLDQPQLCKRISLRKTITKAIVIITIVVVVVLSVKTYFYYDLYKEAQNSIMTHETIIFILAAVLILAIQPVYASDAVITVDGSRYVTIIEDVPTDTIQTFSTTTKTKTKMKMPLEKHFGT